MKNAPRFDAEAGLPGIVAGVDEAGRGPLAGPVVAAAVIFERRIVLRGLRDSKMLTPDRREALAVSIRKRAHIGIGIASVEEIDAVNILQATFLAMRRAVSQLPVAPDACLIDGNQDPGLSCLTRTLVKGDAICASIAAASIIAKTARDAIMRELCQVHPQFGWSSNKGYGAPAHLAALREHGPTQHHRKSFAPVHNMLCADSIGPGAVNQS